MNYLIGQLKELIIEAGKIAIATRNKDLIIEYKEDNSPVTNGDKAVSAFIYNKLQGLTPDILVICEERPLIIPTTNTFWLIDPIDGTKNYIRGKDTYTINIGLIENGEPTIGLIYQPAIDKLYYTSSLNTIKIEQYGKTLEVSNPSFSQGVNINESERGSNLLTEVELKKNPIGLQKKYFIGIVSPGIIDQETANFLKNNYVNEIKYVPGSLKLCFVADGTADIAPKLNHPTMEWDIAAGHSLIKATGGNIMDLSGKQITYGKPNFMNNKYFACNYDWLNSH